MKIKICGMMHPHDAEYAAKEGADYIGINFSPTSKRCVSLLQGKELADATRQNGSQPVAIVVDESLEEILTICEATQIKTVQLHGEKSKDYLKYLKHLNLIYASTTTPDPALIDTIEASNVCLLYDGPNAGSGKPFNWNLFSPPKTPWFLAGGLTPENVGDAIRLLKPFGVDIASGVESIPKRKNPYLVKKFIQNVKYYEEKR